MKRAMAALVFGSMTFSGGALAADPDGPKLFSKNCITCHGKDGKGETDIGEALKITNLTDPKQQARLTDEAITKQITDGTKDKETGKDRMPSFKAVLSPDEIKALIKHVRSLNSEQNVAKAK